MDNRGWFGPTSLEPVEGLRACIRGAVCMFALHLPHCPVEPACTKNCGHSRKLLADHCIASREAFEGGYYRSGANVVRPAKDFGRRGDLGTCQRPTGN